MVISATTRLIGRLALRKAKSVTKKAARRGKDVVKIKKTRSTTTQELDKYGDPIDIDNIAHLSPKVALDPDSSKYVHKDLHKNKLPDVDMVQRRRVVTSESSVLPFVVRKSEEVMGDPMDVVTAGGKARMTIGAPNISETVVSVKGAPKKIIAYKQKDQLQSGYTFSSGLGGEYATDFADFPVRTTSVVYGLGIKNKPMAESLWGIAKPKRVVEAVKQEGMEEMGDPYIGGWKSFHISGIMAGSDVRGKKGFGVKVVKDSGDFDWRKDVYTFGKLTTARTKTNTIKFPHKPVVKPSITIEHHFDTYNTDPYDLLPTHDKKGFGIDRWRDVEHLTFKFGKTRKSKPPSGGYKFYTTFSGSHALTTRIPTRKTRKKIKRVALPAFAAAPTGFIFYSGIKQKAKKKKKGVKR